MEEIKQKDDSPLKLFNQNELNNLSKEAAEFLGSRRKAKNLLIPGFLV